MSAYDPDADEGRGGLVPETRPMRPTWSGDLYRIVERPTGEVYDGHPHPWTWAGTIDGKPRTYRSLRAARIARTAVQRAFDKHNIPMEVAVQRAPVGVWEVVT